MIVPQQIRRARESLDYRLEDAAERLGVEANKLRAWEKGQEEPSFDELCDLADVYHRSVDYFLNDIAPSRRPLALRLAGGPTELSEEAKEARVEWEELCRRRPELERTLGQERNVRLPGRPSATDPLSLAATERQRLGLALGSISDLRGLLETQGVYVFELPIRTGEFSGCSQWHEEYGPCILVNARDTEGRRNFTLAHEYYHLLVERGVFHVCSVDPTARLPEERPANDFAAAFLMTRPGLERALTERRRESPLQEAKDYAPIARKWRVSVEALLYALGDFGLVPKQQVDRLLSEWEAPPVRRKKGTRLPVRWQRRLKHLGKAYTQGALRGYRDGHISLSKLADYLGIDIREARQAAEESR